MTQNQNQKKLCQCPLFRSQGTCYHTGYKPTFREQTPKPQPVPLATQRSQRYVRENLAKWQKEDQAKEQRDLEKRQKG